MARISYVNPDDLQDPELREALHQAMLKSTPRPEIQESGFSIEIAR